MHKRTIEVGSSAAAHAAPARPCRGSAPARAHPGSFARGAALSLSACVLAACALGCSARPPLIAPALESASLGGHVEVHAGGAPFTDVTPVLGKRTRVALWVTNWGDQPVLVTGATPSSQADDLVSLVERREGRARYNLRDNEMHILPRRVLDDYVPIHHGLLFPGETLRLYTDVYPRKVGWTVHQFRVDYLTAPWPELRRHLYVAGPLQAGGRRVYARLEGPPEPDAGYLTPRLRRAVLADGHNSLYKGGASFRVPIEVQRPETTCPLPVAEQIAGLGEDVPLVYSDLLGGWAFARGHDVRVVGAERQPRDIAGVSLAAVRAIDHQRGPVPLLFADIEVYEQLKDLLQPMAAAPASESTGPTMWAVPKAQMAELLARVQARGLRLETSAHEPLVTVKDPGVVPLIARR